MRRWTVILILCFLPVLNVFAQVDDAFNNCGHDSSTLQAAIAADGWDVDALIQLSWSSTCRYLSMRLPSSHGDPGQTIVWDATTNTTVGVIEGFSSGGQRTAWWDESGENLVVTARDVGTYLWHVPTNRQTLINSFDCGLLGSYWDYEHGRLYATAPYSLRGTWCSGQINSGGLRVYDLNTGATLFEYRNYGYTLNYEFSDDGRFVVLSSYSGPVQVFDRASGMPIATVKVNEGGGVSHSSGQIELSPDGRYLAIGMLYIRVWDLTTLPSDLDAQTPTYRYEGPSGWIGNLQFLDNNVIETKTWGDAVNTWDLATGAQLS